MDFDNLKKEINSKYPQFLELFKLLPETKSDWYSFLQLLIAIIILIADGTEPKTSTVINDLSKKQTIINNYYVNQNIISQSDSIDSLRRKKIYPNDPCHCGSGIKYKKCHGK